MRVDFSPITASYFSLMADILIISKVRDATPWPAAAKKRPTFRKRRPHAKRFLAECGSD